MRSSQRLIEAFNGQVGHEMGASLLYTAIGSFFDREDLPALARFFYQQADEERDHAMKFVKYLVDVGANLEIPSLAPTSSGFATAEEAVAEALASEERVTGQIYDLVKIAQEETDYAAVRFLDWFVEEQREEEDVMGTLLSTVRRAGPERLLDVEAYLFREGMVTSPPRPAE